MIKLKKNLTAGVLSCIIVIVYWFLIPIGITTEVQIETNAVGPDYMPKLISGVLVVLGIILIVQSVILKKDEELVVDLKQEKAVLLHLGILLSLIILTPLAGFLISSVVTAVLFLLSMGEKNRLYYVIVLVICVLIYLLFRFALGVPVP